VIIFLIMFYVGEQKKDKHMKKINGCLAFLAMAISVIGAEIRSGYFIVPAANSTNISTSLQNLYGYVGGGWRVGYINTDVAHNPAALNLPNVLRASQIIFGSTNRYRDAVPATGASAGEHGSRIAWAIDWKQASPFLASSVYFALRSTDPANTLGYSGNMATNTSGGAALKFSTTLRGELWDSSGNIVASYHNGESVATHPINRLIGTIRIGWFADSWETINLDLNYFKTVMNGGSFASVAVFYMKGADGSVVAGVTNQMTCRPFVHSPIRNGTNMVVTVEGQRHLGLTYELLRKPILGTLGVPWVSVSEGPEGVLIDPTEVGFQAYYKVRETAPTPPLYAGQVGGNNPPILMVENGPE
jgi:hypothetical protein